MSLEAILESNTAALEKHTAVLQALLERLGAGALPAATTETAAAPAAAAPAAAAPAAAAPAATKSVATPPPPPAPAAAAAPATTVAYDDIKPLIVKLAAKNRAAATALLSGFGVTKGPDLKAEQYPEVLAKLQAALA